LVQTAACEFEVAGRSSQMRPSWSPSVPGCDELPLQPFTVMQYAQGSSPRPVRNHHPTVKPIALMRWLVALITPPGGLVVDPFCGSGSTGAAAVLEARRFVGIELDPSYIAIAQRRIRHWAGQASSKEEDPGPFAQGRRSRS
jgi:site-specific DNA-methyltransferase (adenine-specific)